MPRPNHGTDGDMDGHTMVVMVMPMERGLPMLNPHPVLMPRPNHGTDGDMGGHTMVVMPMGRGLPMPNPHPLLMLRLSPGTMVDMDGHIMVATMDTERGLLMLNLPPMLMPSPNHGITAATDTDGPTMVTAIMERGPLMPNLPPMLMPSPNHGGMAATEHMPGPTMVTPTGVELIGSKH